MDSSINSDAVDSGSSAGAEICAPLDAFSVQGTPPAEGDSVKFECQGTVSRVDGVNAYVTPETVNGQPVMQDQAEEMDEGALRQNLQGLDSGY